MEGIDKFTLLWFLFCVLGIIYYLSIASWIIAFAWGLAFIIALISISKHNLRKDD